MCCAIYCTLFSLSVCLSVCLSVVRPLCWADWPLSCNLPTAPLNSLHLLLRYHFCHVFHVLHYNWCGKKQFYFVEQWTCCDCDSRPCTLHLLYVHCLHAVIQCAGIYPLVWYIRMLWCIMVVQVICCLQVTPREVSAISCHTCGLTLPYTRMCTACLVSPRPLLPSIFMLWCHRWCHNINWRGEAVWLRKTTACLGCEAYVYSAMWQPMTYLLSFHLWQCPQYLRYQ